MTWTICPGSAFVLSSVGVEQYFLLNVFSHQPLQHPFRLGDQRVQVHYSGLEHLPAAKGKQLRRQRSGALSGLFNRL